MKKFLKKSYIYILSILLICIDQLVKFLIIKNINKLPVIVVKNFLSFNYCENRGVAFSLGSGNVVLFIILNIILITGLIIYYEKNKEEFNKFTKICISLIIAGGFSNLLDRIFRGFVVDFIDISELIQYPVFNIADIFIVCGVFGVMIFYIRELLKNRSERE